MTEIWTRDEIESPCVKICVIKQDVGLCVGCFRSPDEIGAWSMMTPEQRKDIIGELGAREKLLTPKRKGGRRAKRP